MLRFSFAVAAFALVVTTAQADVYKTVDAQGQPHYSDKWSPGAQLIKSSHNAPAPPDNSSTASNNGAQSADPGKTAAKEVQSDMQSQRADQCKELKEQYAKEVRARRIYQPSEDSSAPKQYMTDAEADAERVKTRQAMDEACAGTGG